MKNHAMKSGMSLFLFYASVYPNESKMQLKISNIFFIKNLIIMSISRNIHIPYVCDPLGPYI